VLIAQLPNKEMLIDFIAAYALYI